MKANSSRRKHAGKPRALKAKVVRPSSAARAGAGASAAHRITFEAGPANGKLDRLMIAPRDGHEIFRDRLITDKASEREEYLNQVAKQIGNDPVEFRQSQYASLMGAADAADETQTKLVGEDGGANDSQSSRLVQLAGDAEFWHTPEMQGYATVTVGDHRENWQIRSKRFETWLQFRFYREFSRPANAQAVQDARTALEGRANFDGSEHLAHVRLAEHDDAFYLDLGDDQWHVVRIDSRGWRTIKDCPIRFRRPKGMLPLPVPTAGGSVELLRPFVNVADESWPLVLAWLMAALRPRGPYPVAGLHGEQGSAKSTTARVLRMQVDPNRAPLRSPPKDDQNLMIAASNSWVVCYDNLSYLPQWLSDAMCRLSTGGGFGTRTLFENDEETIFDATRPIILNGISELAASADLLDRSLILNLPPIQNRRSEEKFWAILK